MNGKSIQKLENPEEIAARIERIHQIYDQFQKEVAVLRDSQNILINNILKRLDQEQIQKILNELKGQGS